MFVVERERRVHLAEREVELVGDVRWGVIPFDDQFVHVDYSYAGPLDAGLAAQDVVGADDLGYLTPE